MSKSEILEALPTLSKTERQETQLKLRQLDVEEWFGDDESLTTNEKALLDVRLNAYANDPDGGSSWEEVESRIRYELTKQPSSQNCLDW